MKAILVIDVPDYVNSIARGVLKPIGTAGNLEIGYGSDDGEIIYIKFIDVDRLLLKPVPNKYSELNEGAYEDGWNDCIDKITGEKE